MTKIHQTRDFSETVTRQQQEGSSSSTTTIPHAAGRVQLSPMDLEAIRTGYVDILGPLNTIKARDIEAAIDCGLDASAVLDALEQTALAPRPSHAYLRAILRRYMAMGIRTAEGAEEEREVWRMRREAANQERAAWYKDPAEDMPW